MSGSAVATRPASSLRPTALLRSEIGRLAQRRLVQYSAALVLILMSVGTVICFVAFDPLTPETIRAAQVSHRAYAAEQIGYYDECVASATPATVLERCGTRPTAKTLGDYTQDLQIKPFDINIAMPLLAQLVGVVVAAITFVAGASAIGSDWSTRTIVTIFTWEPRRTRVLSAKAGAISIFAVALALAAQTAWLLVSLVLATTRGVLEPHAGLWTQHLQMVGRLAVLAAVAALLGSALATVFRHTAAAVSTLFAYAVAVEGAVRWMDEAWRPWLLTEQVLGFIRPGGNTVVWTVDYGPEGSFLISNGLGLGFLGVLTTALMTAAWASVIGRDLT